MSTIVPDWNIHKSWNSQNFSALCVWLWRRSPSINVLCRDSEQNLVIEWHVKACLLNECGHWNNTRCCWNNWCLSTITDFNPWSRVLLCFNEVSNNCVCIVVRSYPTNEYAASWVVDWSYWRLHLAWSCTCLNCDSIRVCTPSPVVACSYFDCVICASSNVLCCCVFRTNKVAWETDKMGPEASICSLVPKHIVAYDCTSTLFGVCLQ